MKNEEIKFIQDYMVICIDTTNDLLGLVTTANTALIAKDLDICFHLVECFNELPANKRDYVFGIVVAYVQICMELYPKLEGKLSHTIFNVISLGFTALCGFSKYNDTYESYVIDMLRTHPDICLKMHEET